MILYRKGKLFLALSFALALSLIYFNLTSAKYQFHQVCRGTKWVTDGEGKEVKRTRGVVFGIAVNRFDHLLADGAYVDIHILEDITDLSFGSSTMETLIIDKYKNPESIFENKYVIKLKEKNSITETNVIISNITKTLHYSSEFQDRMVNFDGICTDVEYFDPAR